MIENRKIQMKKVSRKNKNNKEAQKQISKGK